MIRRLSRPNTPLSWFETPRMRLRAYGVLPYLGELGVVSGVLGGFLSIVLLLARPSWETLLFAAGLGGSLGLVLQLLPKPVALRNGTFCYGTSNSYDYRYWPIDHCRVIRMTPVRGVLRIEVEVPVNYHPMHEDRPCQKTTFVVVARPTQGEAIRHAFEAGGATFAPTASQSA